MKLAEFMNTPIPTTWGRWELTDDRTALLIMDGTMPRYVDLTRCTTDGARWFWTRHYAGKGWITPQDTADLVEALQDLEGNAA